MDLQIPLLWPCKGMYTLSLPIQMKRLFFLLVCLIACPCVFAQGSVYQVKLNEVLATGRAFANPQGHGYDRVELFNPTDSPISLAGAGLTDSSLIPGKYVFPDGSTIQP